MKFLLITAILAASISKGDPISRDVAVPAVGEVLADGLWIFTTDDSGNTKAEFTPHEEFINATAEDTAQPARLNERTPHSAIQKRRQGCSPTNTCPAGDIDKANTGLINRFSDPFDLGQHQRVVVCLLNCHIEFRSFLLPYKLQDSLSMHHFKIYCL
jgi:hypothetical protein